MLGHKEAAAARNVFASLNPNGTLFSNGADILDEDRLRHAVFYNPTFMNLYDAGQAYTHTE